MLKKTILCLFILITGQVLTAQISTDSSSSLNLKQQYIVTLSAHTATGNIAALRISVNEGLSGGLSISEVKEMMVQLYAYAGFPRSLNALHVLMAVLEERKKNGILDIAGIEPPNLPAGKSILRTGTENQTRLIGKKISGEVYTFAPVIDRFLKEHLFGAIFSRTNLDWKTRELVTISALAAMTGTEAQLRSHYSVGLYNGLTASQLSMLTDIIGKNSSKQQGLIAKAVLQSVIDQKPYTAARIPEEILFGTGQQINSPNFTGNAWLQSLITADSINNIQVGNVTFAPGARTSWHYHPAGQILLVTSGLGYYQEKGSPKRLLRKGDVVKCPPNTPHWHGASRDQEFIQVAITNGKNGPTVWLDPVTEEIYLAEPLQ
jgi:4-carboxymuconolactone decarboxylase